MPNRREVGSGQGLLEAWAGAPGYFATMLIILPGTTMIFTICLPSM